MDRRSFLRTSALGGAAATAGLAAPAYAQGNRTLTMVTSVPDGFAIFDDAAQLAADRITAMPDGRRNTTSSTSIPALPSSPPCPSA